MTSNVKGDNYDFWRTKMKNILRSHDLWDLVKNEFETATKGSKEEDEDLSVAQKIALRENITKDAKTLGFI